MPIMFQPKPPFIVTVSEERLELLGEVLQDIALSGYLNLGSGNDGVNVSDGAKIRGQGGNDTITVDPLSTGPSNITGGSGNDTIRAGGGDDLLGGDSGDDWIEGRDGADQIWGGSGNDTLVGGVGNDIVRGGTGDDVLYGEFTTYGGLTGIYPADDTISGGLGNDTIVGGIGFDTLTGGGGGDVFKYRTRSDAIPSNTKIEQITDFNAADGDKIDLSVIDADSLTPGNQTFAFVNTPSMLAGTVWIEGSGASQVVKANVDGGTADMVIGVNSGGIALLAADFIL